MKQNLPTYNRRLILYYIRLFQCQQAAADLVPAGGAGGAARLLAATPRLYPHLHTPAGQPGL